jgi:hypothetical protein
MYRHVLLREPQRPKNLVRYCFQLFPFSRRGAKTQRAGPSVSAYFERTQTLRLTLSLFRVVPFTPSTTQANRSLAYVHWNRCASTF